MEFYRNPSNINRELIDGILVDNIWFVWDANAAFRKAQQRENRKVVNVNISCVLENTLEEYNWPSDSNWKEIFPSILAAMITGEAPPHG